MLKSNNQPLKVGVGGGMVVASKRKDIQLRPNNTTLRQRSIDLPMKLNLALTLFEFHNRNNR